MKYLVTWGAVGEREVGGPGELDEVLQQVLAQRERLVVGVYYQADSGRWVGMDLGVGHPERSFVFFNERGAGYGQENGVGTWDGDIVFDDGGQATEYHPEETRVRAQTALAAAREFVTTGEQPTCVCWGE